MAILPELEKLKSETIQGPKIEVFSSRKGVRTALNLILKGRKEVLIHGSINRFKEIMGSYYEIWNQRRSKEKIRAKILTNEEVDVPFAEISLLSEEERSSLQLSQPRTR